jgi:hypothetical protein
VENRDSRFSERVFRLLERVEYRRADSEEEKRAIYGMRHDAYTRAGTVEPRPSGLFHDPLDESPNAWLIGLYIDGVLASALRLHVSADLSAILPATAAFGDVIEPHLRAGRMIIDASRFVSKLEYSKLYPEIPYITLRPTFLAVEFFGADYITAACRLEHQSFYRRMFGGVPWSAPREFPHFKVPMVFLGYDCRARGELTYFRFPFYGSNVEERTRLFSRSSNAAENIQQTIGRETEGQLTDTLVGR